MHELGLASEILEACRRRMPEAARLEEVRVAVGELSAVEPDLLRYAWEAVVAGGPDAAATLEIEWRPARQHCARCGDATRAPGAWLNGCPRCGGRLTVEGGMELDVLQFEYRPAAGEPATA